MMDRREFSRLMALGTLGTGLASTALAQPGSAPVNGTDYLTFDKPLPTEPKGKVEVIEFFMYTCPHCNNFEPALEAWLKKLPKDVVFKRAPLAFHPKVMPLQRLYFTLEAMGKVDSHHKQVFDAIHNQKQKLETPEQIAAWASKAGLDAKTFNDTFQSFAVAGKVSRARQMQDQYRVEGVPALAVGGRYYTDGTMARSMSRALQVVDFLADQVRKG